VATAELYPKFSLTGIFGLESVSAADAVKWQSRAWSVGPTIQWSIFQGGRIRAKIEVENARQEQAAIVYERSILVALQEVEDALIAYSKEHAHRAERFRLGAANVKAVDLANQRYTQGLGRLPERPRRPASLYGSQDALVQSERRISEHLVALYKGAGGGWKSRRIGGIRPRWGRRPEGGIAFARQLSVGGVPGAEAHGHLTDAGRLKGNDFPLVQLRISASTECSVVGSGTSSRSPP
jgi:outer membrane protein TolC